MSFESTSTIDVQTSKLALREDLVFSPQRHRGAVYCHLECKSQGKFYRIGYPQYVFISLLDGRNTFAQALALASQHLRAKALTTAEATQTYMWLLQNQLGQLVEQADPPRRAGAHSRKNPSGLRPTRQRLNPFWLKSSLARHNGPRLTELLDKLVSPFQGAFSPAGTLVGLVVMAVGLAALLLHWTVVSQIADVVFSPSHVLTMIVVWLLLKLVHELGHAAVCRRYGVEINDVGIVFILFAPMPYVDVTSAWRLPSKWQRIHIAAAGMFVELMIAAIAALALVRMGVGPTANTLFNVVLMAGVSTLLFNANPLMRFDGYYILSDLLGIPNLYGEATKRVQERVTWFCFGPWRRNPNGSVHDQSGTASRYVLETYGWLTVFWRILVCASLALAASVLWHGAGIVLAVAGIVMWISPQLTRFAQSLQRRWATDRRSLWRLAISVGCASYVVSWIWLHAPAPFPVSAPGVVEYADVVHLRCDSDAFVEELHVDDGQTVEAGDLLLVLRNDDMTRRYKELKLEMEQTRLRQLIAIDENDVPEARVQARKLESLNRQWSQIEGQFEAQFVRAPVDGKVVRRGLANQIGNFASEGSTLLSIGREDNKEVVVSLAHDDFDRVVDRVGSRVTICLGGLNRVTGVFEKLEPRASTTLPAECLRADEGGPLAVKSVPDDSRINDEEPTLKLIEPRFRGVVSIPGKAADGLPCGQRVQLQVRNGNDRLGQWLFASVSNWMEAKLDQVDSS